MAVPSQRFRMGRNGLRNEFIARRCIIQEVMTVRTEWEFAYYAFGNLWPNVTQVGFLPSFSGN